MAILKGGALGDDQKKQLSAYYDGAAFARWTRPSDYASIPDFRKQLAAELRAARSSQAVSDYLLGLTISRMKEFIKPEYHRVVRYNAMLVIGELITAQGSALPEAQAVLLSELNNPNQNDLVQAAVLIGMIRHGTAGFPDADVRDKQVVAPLLKLAQAPVAPGRSSESHAWLRALAVDALAALRYPGSNGAVAQTLANLVSDDTVSPMVRMSAAKALGNLDYQAAAGGLKPLELLGALVKMTEDVLQDGAKTVPAPARRVVGCQARIRKAGQAFQASRGRVPWPIRDGGRRKPGRPGSRPPIPPPAQDPVECREGRAGHSEQDPRHGSCSSVCRNGRRAGKGGPEHV